MKARLAAWWRAWRRLAWQSNFDRGFDYAAGELLRGRMLLSTLEMQASGFMNGQDPFEAGMRDALTAWAIARLTRKVDG